MYTRQCAQPDLHVKVLMGHASAPVGRPVPNAEIVLLDADKNQVAHVSTDSNGNFSFPDPLDGTFKLRIDGGFNPIYTSLHIEPAARNSSLEIDVANGEICSSVWAK